MCLKVIEPNENVESIQGRPLCTIFLKLSLGWCGATRSERVNQKRWYHAILICLAVSGNTHMSVFILVPSQVPLEGQVIAF